MVNDGVGQVQSLLFSKSNPLCRDAESQKHFVIFVTNHQANFPFVCWMNLSIWKLSSSPKFHIFLGNLKILIKVTTLFRCHSFAVITHKFYLKSCFKLSLSMRLGPDSLAVKFIKMLRNCNAPDLRHA